MKLYRTFCEYIRHNTQLVLTTLNKYCFLFTITVLMVQAEVYGQSKTDIYIPIDGRKEIRLAPKIDTLTNFEEYTYKMTIDPQFRFSELFCERGLVVKTDNFLRITPNSNKKSGIDTLTLKFVLFSNNSRVLMYKHIFVRAEQRSYPKSLKKQVEAVTIDNTTLERNSSYRKDNFRQKSVFSFYSPENIPDSSRRVLSVTISMVNKDISKSFFIKGDQITTDVLNEIRKQKQPTQTYVRLDIKVGKKYKSVWTRFTMNG